MFDYSYAGAAWMTAFWRLLLPNRKQAASALVSFIVFAGTTGIFLLHLSTYSYHWNDLCHIRIVMPLIY